MGIQDQEEKIVIGKGAITIETKLNGKTVAKETAPYMDQELGSIYRRKK